MADVENVSAINAAATTSSQAVTGADISTAQDVFGKSGEGGGPVNEVIIEGNQTSNDLGTSPTQEKSSNSHPHDSEYDTASDLEGNEEYDDDDMDDSLTEDDEDDSEDETESDDDEEDDDEGVDVDLQGQEKIDAEAQKKVDEDRSNPQYIPKRGTFYEHDDRTAEVEGDVEGGDGQEAGESPVVITGGSSSVPGSKTATTPTISSASKTMKKWQPASAVDRWSHDRFDPSEQAPKSRAELVNAYGYDIRTEDAPPKARRRRRYGRGPSKYNRNWEDESAYLKTSNKERKPPKPSDFPALNENSSKPRRPRRTREEKENRMDRKKRESKTLEGRTERTDKMGPSSRNNHNDEHDHRVEQRNDRGDRHNDISYKQQNRQKSFTHRGQGQNQASVGRQAAMEFKQKNRQNYQNSSSAQANTNTSTLSSRLEAQRQQPQQNQQQQPQQQNMSRKSVNNVGNSKDNNQPIGNQNQQQQNQQYDGFNNNKKKHLEQGYQPMQAIQHHATLGQQQHQQQAQSSPLLNHSVNRQNAQIQNKTQQQPTSNLSQRLQQVQNRNDPSHVGSVQMHALATQNQQQQLLQQQQAANVIMAGPPQAQLQQSQNQNINQQSMEQRGPPKRYSSLRRSQHDGQHLAEHQQLQQQIHMQQQQQQQNQAPPAMMMPTDQAMIQANLMQMYHQEKLQAQMQALQVSQQPTVAKAPNYAGQGPQAPPQQPYPGNTPTPAAYFVASPDAYTAAATAAATAQVTQAAASYAAQQANPNYLAQQQTAAAAAAAAASLVYNNPNNAPQQSVAAATAYGPAAQVGVVTQPQTGSTTAPGYQNYNTVGGTTYFVPPPTQTSTRPVSLPQRRPTNAIPILPPSEKQKQKSQDSKIDNDTKGSTNQSSSNQAPVGSAENIDHIIDNMFVQRPAFQPPPATTTSTTGAVANATSKSNDVAVAAPDNLNNTSSPSQDSNTLITENVTIKAPNDTTVVITTASSATTTATTTASTESSNNNQISAQE